MTPLGGLGCDHPPRSTAKTVLPESGRSDAKAALKGSVADHRLSLDHAQHLTEQGGLSRLFSLLLPGTLAYSVVLPRPRDGWYYEYLPYGCK